MPEVETNTKKVLVRLLAEGWIVEGGSKHTKLSHSGRPGTKIMVPRHRTLTPGVARSIARTAGWL